MIIGKIIKKIFKMTETICLIIDLRNGVIIEVVGQLCQTY